MATRAYVLHGLGDQGLSWSGLPRELKLSAGPTIWSFPDAPISAVACNGGARMRSWFDLAEIPIVCSSPDDESGLLKAADDLLALVAESGTPTSNIVLGGFSQGAVVVMLAALRSHTPFAGVFMLSGWVPMREKLKDVFAGAAQTPFFYGHGEADPVVTIDLAYASRDALTNVGVGVEFHSFAGMAHSTCGEEMRLLKEFLGPRLA